jgi:hypothetical protein
MANVKEAQPHLRCRGRKRAPVKPGWRAAKETSTHRGGHPAFVPTHTERRFVQAMAGLRMSADEICAVIGSGRNGEDTGKPISKATLYRHFRNELANGRAMLKARVAGKFYAVLDDDAPWAIQFGMRNLFGWDAGRNGFHAMLDDSAAALPGGTEPLHLDVHFVMPDRKKLEDLRDVTPDRSDSHDRSRTNPSSSSSRTIDPAPRRDYPRPEPPVIDAQVLPPTSVPIVGRKKPGFDWS